MPITCDQNVCYDDLIPHLGSPASMIVCALPDHSIGECPPKSTDEISQMLAICSKHEIWSTSGRDTRGEYAPAWKACTKVHDQWLKSEAHRKLIEAQEQDERDRKLVEDYVKGLE